MRALARETKAKFRVFMNESTSSHSQSVFRKSELQSLRGLKLRFIAAYFRSSCNPSCRLKTRKRQENRANSNSDPNSNSNANQNRAAKRYCFLHAFVSARLACRQRSGLWVCLCFFVWRCRRSVTFCEPKQARLSAFDSIFNSWFVVSFLQTQRA